MKTICVAQDNELTGGRQQETTSREWMASALSTPGYAALNGPVVPIVYKGRGVCRVAVQARERVYCFTAEDPEQIVEVKDAEALLKTGLFAVKL